MKKRINFIALLIIITLIIISCNFTTSTTNTYDKVKIGMTTEQVIEAMGETSSITKTETWEYQEDDTTIDISIQDGKVVNVRTVTVRSLQRKSK